MTLELDFFKATKNTKVVDGWKPPLEDSISITSCGLGKNGHCDIYIIESNKGHLDQHLYGVYGTDLDPKINDSTMEKSKNVFVI